MKRAQTRKIIIAFSVAVLFFAFIFLSYRISKQKFLALDENAAGKQTVHEDKNR